MKWAVAALACLPLSAVAMAASLTVRVSGIQGREGQIVVKLFATEDGFPVGPGLARAAGPVMNGAALTIDGVAPGIYAVIAIHDRNSDGKMDKNFLGLPLEGYGLSTNPRPLLAPRFNDGKFRILDGDNMIEVSLVYY